MREGNVHTVIHIALLRQFSNHLLYSLIIVLLLLLKREKASKTGHVKDLNDLI